jgi:hypothetical protein
VRDWGTVPGALPKWLDERNNIHLPHNSYNADLSAPNPGLGQGRRAASLLRFLAFPDRPARKAVPAIASSVSGCNGSSVGSPPKNAPVDVNCRQKSVPMSTAHATHTPSAFTEIRGSRRQTALALIAALTVAVSSTLIAAMLIALGVAA